LQYLEKYKPGASPTCSVATSSRLDRLCVYEGSSRYNVKYALEPREDAKRRKSQTDSRTSCKLALTGSVREIAKTEAINTNCEVLKIQF